MNKHCQLFYKRLRILFPSIGFAEGKFLRDIKMQLRDFSIENPGSDYEDVVAFFGSPEEVFVNYMQDKRGEEIYSKLLILKIIRKVLYIIPIVLSIILLILCFYLHKSYHFFHDTMPKISETIIEKGEYSNEKN